MVVKLGLYGRPCTRLAHPTPLGQLGHNDGGTSWLGSKEENISHRVDGMGGLICFVVLARDIVRIQRISSMWTLTLHPRMAENHFSSQHIRRLIEKFPYLPKHGSRRGLEG
jgi:hypothetical protein